MRSSLVILSSAAAVCGVFHVGSLVKASESERAAEIFELADVSGGLIVHLGCGDGQLTVALRASDAFLVHGLDTDPQQVAAARKYLQSVGLTGDVCVDRFDGKHLPFIDHLVNLVVISDRSSVDDEELLRVLAPGGAAVNVDPETGNRKPETCLRKPWPDDIDEWTHYLHDASNNAVAHDRQIGPPRHLQWQCGPRWSRHHDHMASMSAMVSARGRVFYILDEGSRISPQLPADWKLVARDAFNGVQLWKRTLGQWHNHLWPLKSGPASLPRRLVAVGEAVYATLAIDAPVSALDAASGKKVREYENTAGAEEIVYKDGVLLVLVNRTPMDLEADLAVDPEKGGSRDGRTTFSPTMSRIWAGIRSRRWTHSDRSILAFDAESGRPLWKKAGRVIPLTLAADAKNAYFHDGERVVAVSLSQGEPQWTSDPVPVWQGLHGQGLQSWFAPTLVAIDGRVLFAGGEKTHMSYMGWGSPDIGQDTMTALSAETGKKLWTADHPYAGYNSPEDLFVIDGRVWTGQTAKGGGDGRYSGRSLNTGELEKDFPPTLSTFWFHHRCHRAKATDKYVLCSRTGIEFVDLDSGEWTINHWVRGGCLYGIMPCNGMLYVPPHPCACYPEAKLYGFTALTAASPSRAVPEAAPADQRLEKGPAYDSPTNLKSEIRNLNSEDWPTYRQNPARSGASSSTVPAELQQKWKVRLDGPLTQPIVADGSLFVADPDRHMVHGLDARSGERRWSYVAGGRIDSAPTFDRGCLLFGSADGYVYCVRAADGELVWRFRAAPVDRRMVAFGRVESAWPVHGSVLVQDGVATVVAGRSMYLDDGLRLCRLDAATGQLLSEKVLGDRDPETSASLQVRVKGLNMPVALPDILSSDGEHLFMRSQTMDLEGNRLALGPGATGPDHLFAAYGFTDDTWFHRTYWLYGNSYSGGVGGFGNAKKKPAGRILVHDRANIYGYGRKPQHYRWSSVADYHLYAAPKPGGNSGSPRAIFFKNSPSLDPTGQPLTIAAWVKTDAADGTILVRGAQANGFALILSQRKPRMLLRTRGATHDVVSDRPIGNDWTHVAAVLDKEGRMSVYINGEITGSIDDVPTLSGEPSIAMKVGYDDTQQLLPRPLTPFSGAMDEVMLFHRALSAEEIQRLADPAKKLDDDAPEGQVLHLSFTGGRIRDHSSGKNHGQVQGAKVETVAGPVGDALKLVQPKTWISPPAGKRASAVAYRWTRDVPMMVRAMALAGDQLLIAGPPDLIDEEAAFQDYADPATQKQLARQDAALKGKSGAIFHIVNAPTGEIRSERQLHSPPVFDGLIVAGGRVYVSLMDGTLVCYE
jgi:outer membrane protein assembly factor BamB